MPKIENFTIEGHNSSHFSEMGFTLITNLKNITFEHYLNQPKSMLEWRLIEKLARNPILINAFDRIVSYPLFRGYSNVDPLESHGEK